MNTPENDQSISDEATEYLRNQPSQRDLGIFLTSLLKRCQQNEGTSGILFDRIRRSSDGLEIENQFYTQPVLGEDNFSRIATVTVFSRGTKDNITDYHFWSRADPALPDKVYIEVRKQQFS